MFVSAVDGGYYLLLAVIAATAAFSLYAEDEAEGIVLLLEAGVALLGLALPIWLLLDTRYTVDDACLRVRSGPFRWRIPRPTIQRIEASRSLIAGPALSRRRLKLCYGPGKTLLLSPADEAGFLEALGQRLAAGTKAGNTTSG